MRTYPHSPPSFLGPSPFPFGVGAIPCTGMWGPLAQHLVATASVRLQLALAAATPATAATPSAQPPAASLAPASSCMLHLLPPDLAPAPLPPPPAPPPPAQRPAPGRETAPEAEEKACLQAMATSRAATQQHPFVARLFDILRTRTAAVRSAGLS